MNKKLFVLGVAAMATAGYLSLTAFGGMTKAQQEAGIAEKVTAALADLKTAKAKECEDRIAAAANTKAKEMLAAPAPAEQKPMAGPSKPSKKPTPKPGAKDPKPQAPSVPPAKAPEKTQPESQSKWNQGGEQKPQESKSKWAQPAPDGAAPAKQESKSKWDKKKEGGGK